MKKLKGNPWVKLVVLLLAVIFCMSALLCGVAAVLFGTQPELQKPAKEIERLVDSELLTTYGAALLGELDTSDASSVQGQDALEGGNIRYTLVQRTYTDAAQDGEGQDASGDGEAEAEDAANGGDAVQIEYSDTVIYTNDESVGADDCIVCMDYYAGMSYSYNSEGFWNAVRGSSSRVVYDAHYAYTDTGEVYFYEDEAEYATRYLLYLSVGTLWNDTGDGSLSVTSGERTLANGLTDYTYEAAELAQWLCRFRRTSGGWLAASLVLFFACFGFLMSAAGHRVADGEIHLRWTDKVPLGIWIAAECVVLPLSCVGILWLADEYLDWSNISMGFAVSGAASIAAVALLCAFFFCMSLAVRLKAKRFWRYTLLYYLSRPLSFICRMVKTNVPLFVKGILLLGALTVLELLALAEGVYDEEVLFGLFFIYKLVEIPLFLHLLYQMNLLKKGGIRVAAGDYGEPIDTRRMLWEFKRHGENINSVGKGIALAVEERMKSERFKTELITNVSHDIKTPLTSLINYVDLMKKEEIADPTLRGYVEVLDRQSERLKKLIEDLMEASKASTGNLPVHLEECDATVMLSQVVGEFEERARENELELVVTAPEPPVCILADGRHLWRIIDNLMGNICKYAMPKTRVYIDLEVFHGMVIMTFKNISKTRLNIPSEELMERFVRGDSSRNTEGSGLGLSIARSLAGLMDGNMAIQIDGDLFKAIVSFAELKK